MANDFFCLTQDIPKAELENLLQEQERKKKQGIKSTRAAADRTKLWENGQTIRISFGHGSDPGVVRDVESVAKEWTEHANLNFVFLPVRDPSADVRVTFVPPGGPSPPSGYWSLFGTDSRPRPGQPPQQSMNLGEAHLVGDEEFRHVVLHEFGHAIGLIHEHQNPDSGAPSWNEQAVIAFFSGPPNNWPPERVVQQIIRRAQLNTTNFTEFDPDSIMMYTFPAHLTRDGRGFHRNSQLSDTDKKFVRDLYPGRSPTGGGGGGPVGDPIELTVGSAKEGNLRNLSQRDLYKFSVAKERHHMIVTRSSSDVVTVLCGPNDRKKQIQKAGPNSENKIGNILDPGEYFIEVSVDPTSSPGTYKIIVEV